MYSPPARRGAALAAALALVLVSLLAASSAHAAATATLTTTSTLDFANRQVDGVASATKTFTFRSTGTDAVTTTGTSLVGTDPGQFTIVTDNCVAKTLITNATCTVTVAYKPTALGPHAAALQVTSNAPTATSPTFTGTGRNLSASGPGFGGQPVGSSTTKTITVTNNAPTSYTLGAVTVSGTGYTKGADTCSAAALTTGASCTVDVTFAPTSPGVKTGSLVIASYGPNFPLDGIGTQAATSLSQPAVVFADQGAATSAPRSVTLTNTGSGPLAVSGATLDGLDADDFAITSDGCASGALNVGQSCTVAVAFAPTDGGWKTGLLRIASSAGGPVTTARLSGRSTEDGADTDPFASFLFADQPLARLQGDGGDSTGGALADGACDVNGDGYDDVIEGAPLWSTNVPALSWEGGAYVTLGGPGFGGADLATKPRGRVVFLQGVGEKAQTGTGVGCAGDVNGDGIDDLVVGAWAYEYPGRTPAGASITSVARGRAYVVFGARDFATRDVPDLGNLGSAGYMITSPEPATPDAAGYAANADAWDHLGYAILGVGDVNGDGLSDLAIMANTAPRVYLVAGQASTTTQNLADPGAVLAEFRAPSTMSPLVRVGDVDGDGTPDLAMSSYTYAYTPPGGAARSAAGTAWVVSGAKRGVVDLTDPSQSILAVAGAFASHRVGIGLGAAGDVNGDGLDDLIAGADSTSAANSDAAYVVYGTSTPSGVVIDTAALGTRGYRILGAPGSSTGYGITAAGDVNHDGADDLAVGAYAAGSGSVSLLYGVVDPTTLPANDAASGLVPANPADTTHYLSLATLTPAQGSKLEGQTTSERFGRTIATLGDVDGNGAADLAIGSDQAYRRDRTDSGEVSVVLMPGPPTPKPAPAVTPVGGGGGGSSEPEATPQTPAPSAEPSGAGPGTTGPSTGPSTSTRTAVPTLATRRSKVDQRRRMPLVVRCVDSDGTCAGSLVVTIAGRKLSTVRWSVRSGATTTVRVTLPRSVVAKLKRSGRLNASVRLTAGSQTRTVRVAVRPAGER